MNALAMAQHKNLLATTDSIETCTHIYIYGQHVLPKVNVNTNIETDLY